jgi:hypothetical protein
MKYQYGVVKLVASDFGLYSLCPAAAACVSTILGDMQIGCELYV